MKDDLELVSIIIPCKNEEKYIEKCLDSVMSQSFDKERLEILVIDGMSSDRTRDFVKKYPAKVELLDNPKKIFASAVNIGVRAAKGDIIIILGSHAIYPKNYVEKCVKYLEDYNADNIGGEVEPIPYKNTILSKAIALSLKGFLGRGKRKRKEAAQVDTVFGGCYKKEVFKKIGMFNENLAGSSDIEFNLRLIRTGGKIISAPDIVAYYYPKDNIKDFFFHNIRDGIWATYPLKFTKTPLKLRHYLPLIFVLTLPLSIWLYFPVIIYFSLKIASEEKRLGYLFLMPIVFAARHIGYGLGSVAGLIKLIV